MDRNDRSRRRPQRDGGSHRKLLWLFNGVLAGGGGGFLTTPSAAVTASAPAAPEPRSGHWAGLARASAEEEFEAFFNEHYEALLSFATWWGKDHHDADDALARVMVHIGQNWSTIRDPGAYARKSVTWAILNVRRDRHDGRYVPVAADQLLDQTYDGCELDQMEGQEWVDDLLGKLPPTQRAVLSRFLDGLSMSEIAAELRKSES